MSSAAERVERTVVILASSTWVSELSAELVRTGIPESDAPRRAAHLLGRIVRHAGWERNHFLAPDLEPEPVKDKTDGRGRSKSKFEVEAS